MSRSSRASCGAHARGHRAIPLARAGLDQLLEVGDLGPAVGDRVVGKAVAEILEREARARGDLAGGGDGLRQIGEAPGHLGRGAEVLPGVRRQAPAERLERGPEPDRRQDIEDRSLLGRGVTHASGGDDRQPGLARERHGAAGHELALARPVPLELHVDPIPAEGPREPLERRPRRRAAARQEIRRQRPVQAAGQAQEPRHRAVEVVERRAGLALPRARLHPRDEPAERLVAGARLDEETEPRAVDERERGARRAGARPPRRPPCGTAERRRRRPRRAARARAPRGAPPRRRDARASTPPRGS